MNMLILGSYLFLQFLICLYISKRIRSEDDYLVAGRNLPHLMVAVSLFATWFGAETCIGSSSAVYQQGLSGSRADPLGYSLCLILSGILIAPKVWSRKYTTLADVYKNRFGRKTETLATWILALSSLIWAAAQLRAFSQVVSATTDLPVDTTLLISFLFVVAYTMLGGLLGDVITDVIQGVVISLGLFLLFFLVLNRTPEGWSILANQPLERLTIFSPSETIWARLDRWAIPIFGSLVAQEIVARILAARNQTIATRACFTAAFIYILLGAIPVVLGLMGPQLMSMDGQDHEQFLILLAEKYMPALLVPVFAGALISALLATIDSILLSVSALFSHNLIIPSLKVKDEKQKLRISRGLVFVAGMTAYVMAVHAESIYELLETASSFGTSGILVITMAALWTQWGDDVAALVSLFVGLFATPFAEYVLQVESPFLFSIAAAAITFLAFALPPKPQKRRLTQA